jgi:hypothetical protein
VLALPTWSASCYAPDANYKGRGIVMSLSYILYIIGAIVVIVVILKVLGLY